MLLGEVWVISPFITCVPVPAAKVPADAATSSPPLPATIVLTESVYVLVEPEVTVVGPLRVMLGAVPLLWHEVQVDPVLPEKPEIPPLLAAAGKAKTSTIRVTSAIHNKPMTRQVALRCGKFVRGDGGTVFRAAKNGREFLSFTVASFLSAAAWRVTAASGGRRMQLSERLNPSGSKHT